MLEQTEKDIEGFSHQYGVLSEYAHPQTDEAIAAAVDKKELPAMELGAMCYMMSKQGYGGDSVEH